MTPGATLRTVCVTAAICAVSLSGCEVPQPVKKAPGAVPAPVSKPAAPSAAPPPLPPTEVPLQLAPASKPKAPAKKRAPKPKPPEPVAQPAPPPPPPPAPNPDEERAKKRDAYLAALAKAVFTFNAPSPMQLEQRTAVTLSVNPPAETAQLADDFRKSLDTGTVWSPRLRARLGGADFQIAPADAKDADGAKDLSPSGRTDWRWSVLPQAPGTKRLAVTLAVLLPPGLGGPRELPTISRPVEVEATLGWRAEQLWADYWRWLAAALAVVLAIAWWARR